MSVHILAFVPKSAPLQMPRAFREIGIALEGPRLAAPGELAYTLPECVSREIGIGAVSRTRFALAEAPRPVLACEVWIDAAGLPILVGVRWEGGRA